MKRTVLLWILAVVITIASAVYQRMTGPTYPVSGTTTFAGKALSFKFLRTCETIEDAPVVVKVSDSTVSAVLEWRRYNSDDDWTLVPMAFENNTLSARIPRQPAAGKVEYRVILTSGDSHMRLPVNEDVVLRYKGVVPTAILIIHVIAMFGAMLLSTRTGLEFFNPAPRLAALIPWTIGFLAVGGLILGPIVQKYAFGAFWTGWPFGHDLTDNKTLVALLAWVAAAVALRRARNPRSWALAAAILTFVVYMIPHSVLGSEIDYREAQKKQLTGTEVDSRQ